MTKVDLKKEFKELYQASAKKPALVEVPKLPYLMADGHGDPNTSPLFVECVEAMYGLAYTLKFLLKKGPREMDWVVMPLEGLWWAADMEAFRSGDKSQWLWTLMMMQPRFVTPEEVEEARAQVKAKKDPAGLDRVRFETYEDGLSAQILHIGPYAEEEPTINKLHEFIEAEGYALSGKHREIYLSDARRTAPEKLRTIIRQPIEKA